MVLRFRRREEVRLSLRRSLPCPGRQDQLHPHLLRSNRGLHAARSDARSNVELTSGVARTRWRVSRTGRTSPERALRNVLDPFSARSSPSATSGWMVYGGHNNRPPRGGSPIGLRPAEQYRLRCRAGPGSSTTAACARPTSRRPRRAVPARPVDHRPASLHRPRHGRRTPSRLRVRCSAGRDRRCADDEVPLRVSG